jgi:anaerobic selenocysteine-containing dehydrogenase
MSNHLGRRTFLVRTGQALVGGALGSVAFTARAGDATKALDAFYEMSADTQSKCATCEYWGGIRKISMDGQAVLTQSLGWCNNPDSAHYNTLTTPETGPMKSWKRWQVLT